jgi:hypothetical protein
MDGTNLDIRFGFVGPDSERGKGGQGKKRKLHSGVFVNKERTTVGASFVQSIPCCFLLFLN